jgi:Fe-S-cluster containining protein
MLNPKKLRFVCTRCGNCCTDRNTLVNVTYLDILKIVKGLNLDLAESLEIFGFYVFNNDITISNLEKMVIPPVKTEKGLAFLALMKNNRGECCFYDKSKSICLIYDLRPIFCKSFPFTFTSSQKGEKIEINYTEKAKTYCPGIEDDAPLVDLAYLRDLAQKILITLEHNYSFIKQWNKNVSNGRISPSARNFLRSISDIKE